MNFASLYKNPKIYLSIIGGAIASLLGGWDLIIKILVGLMITDYICGVTAAILGKSKHSETGSLSSYVGIQGIVKKVMLLVLVGVSFSIDLLLGKQFLRNVVAIGISLNEIISIIENCVLMGVNVPPILRKTVEVYAKQYNEEGVENAK